MTGNKILLDTNIVSALLKGDTHLSDRIDAYKDVFISAIVVGELYYGAEYSTQIEKNKANIAQITSVYESLSVTTETAKIYGIIKAALRDQGTPIPENDIWIAAIAKQHKLYLVTRDKHFAYVKTLNTFNW